MKRFLSLVMTFALLCGMMVITAANDVAFAASEIVRNTVTVSLGGHHSAAIKTDGSLWLWDENKYDLIGDGTATDQETPVKIMDNVASVSLGEYHSAAIKTDGSLWLWGSNSDGQIGNGTTTDQKTPVKIMDNVASVSLGEFHSAAIKTDGSLWMWGDNLGGQIGNGTTADHKTPIKIMDDVASVSLGEYHSAAIKTDGSLWLWGNNSDGQIGNGTTTDQKTPVKIMDNVASVSLGEYHSAAIKTDGSLWMWGWNKYGQIGNGTTSDQYTPIKIMDDVASVSLGEDHSAAIKTDGSLWLWGENYFGEIGNGTTTDQLTPVKIMNNVASVSLDGAHSAAIKTDGSLWWWGHSSFGQTGASDFKRQKTPIKIMDNLALPSSTPATKKEESKDVKVTLPTFKITINNQKIVNDYAKYPFIVYNDITYFPMTYDGARFLGLLTNWDAVNGLVISKMQDGGTNKKESAIQYIPNEPTYNTQTATGSITVNGKKIDNSKERYPLITFRNVTYFPLTWRFAVDEFGWEYNYTNENGLTINSQKKQQPESEKKEDNKESTASSVNKLEVSVERVTSIYPNDPDSARRIKINVKNLSHDSITVVLNGNESFVDKADAAEDVSVKIGETSCIRVTTGSEYIHKKLAPGASFNLESIVNFDCFKQEKCGGDHTLIVTASANGFISGSDTITLSKPTYVDHQQLFDNASVDLAKRSTEIVDKLCSKTASKTKDDPEIIELRNAVKNQIKVTNLNGRTVSVPDAVYDAFINAIVQGIYDGNIDEKLETKQTKLTNQIADAIADGSISGYETVIIDGCSYAVDYDVVAFLEVGLGMATVKWTDKNKTRQEIEMVWTSDVDDGVNAVSEYCAKLIILTDDLYKDFAAYMVIDTLGLMGINKIKKDDVVEVFNKTEKIIKALYDEDAEQALLDEIGGNFKNELKNKWGNAIRDYVKKYVPNGEAIVNAADKYKTAKGKYDKWKNLLSGDYDLDMAEELYNEFQKAYADLENAINNI